ncbi:hypothetical protein PJM70_30565, partial [Mycobacterium kansasii]
MAKMSGKSQTISSSSKIHQTSHTSSTTFIGFNWAKTGIKNQPYTPPCADGHKIQAAPPTHLAQR